jgi:hypothetical protein
MAIDIVIQGDYRDRDIKRAQRDLDLLGNQSGMTGAAFARMGGLAAGMGAAIGTAAIQAVSAGAQMAVEFGVNGVKAFIADDAAAKRLAQTLSNLGLEGATAAVEANIDSLQRASGVADDVLRPAFGRLVVSTGNVAEANKLLSLAIDISAGTGKDLNQVVMALGKASDGSTAGLSRLGVGLDKATLATGDMDLITKELARTFGGQALVKAQTFQGQIDRVAIAFGELQESFGRGFMAGVVSGFNNGRTAGDQLADTLHALEPTFYDLGQTIGGVVQYIPQFVAGFKVIINAATLTRETLLSTVKGFIALGQAVSGDFDAASATARDALDRIKVSGDSVIVAFNELTSGALPAARGALSGTVASAIAAGNALGGSTGGGGAGGGGGTSLAGGASAAADKTVILTDKQKNLAQTMAGTQVAVKQATDELAGLTKASEDYAASITGAIQGTVDLSTAFSAAQKASQEGTLAAGESVVSTTIANFQAQILAAKQFADSLIAVSNAGGSQSLIDQILKVAGDQGPGAGAFLANTLVSEGVVPQLTADLAAFDVFAGQAGTALADKFYAQGITSAVALLNGLSTEVAAQKKQLDRLGQNIGQPIAAAIADEIAQAIRDGVADGRAAAARRRAEAAVASFVASTIAPSTAVAAASFSGGGMVNLPGLATGGAASAGRPYIVGEKGPELFVPGSNGNVVPNNAMGGNTYQITVQAGVGDPRAIGQQIVEYVRKFEQANGPVFRAA